VSQERNKDSNGTKNQTARYLYWSHHEYVKRILVAAVMSWAYSVTLGLLFAVAASEKHSLRTLLLPAVVPVALIGSTIVAIAITQWLLVCENGARNLWFYGPTRCPN